MEAGFKVCAQDITTEFTEKKSRFISYLACVENEEDAKAFIESVREKHKDATHNCIAYRLREPRVERFSDDGEPAGTAGMPMLEVLKKEDVYNVCVVVTRYFGGILLGGGGLIRAYSRGVSNALSESGFAVRDACVVSSFTYSYGGHDKVLKLLETVTHNQISCEYSENIKMTLSVKLSDYDKLVSAVRDALCGNVEIAEIERKFDSFK